MSIPDTIHFTYFRGPKNWAWRDIHTLCLLSAVRNAQLKPVVHYDREGEGYWWETARKIPGVTWRPALYFGTVNGHAVSDQRLPHDYFRLKRLEEEGGVYSDLDFIFLKDMRPLLQNEVFIGTQNTEKKKLACGLIGAVPGAAFVREYRRVYDNWKPEHERKFWQFANSIPWDLSLTHPCTVLPRRAFYPWPWSNKTFLKGQELNLGKSYAIHLWESLHPDLTTEDLASVAVSPWVRPLMAELLSLNPPI